MKTVKHTKTKTKTGRTTENTKHTEDMVGRQNGKAANGGRDASATPTNGRVFVDIELLEADPEQPRKVFAPEKLKELGETIKEHGIVQDLLVRRVPARVRVLEPDLVCKDWRVIDRVSGKEEFTGNEGPAKIMAKGEDRERYIILDGERRWRVAKALGLKVVPVAVREVDAKQKLAQQTVANQQHENLTALEEAEAFKKELASGRHTADTLHKALGISRSQLFSRLALTKLHTPVREAVVGGKISVSVAGLVAMVPLPKDQEALLKEIGDEGHHQYPFSFRAVQEIIERNYSKPLRGCAWDVKDSQLVPKAGSCADCPKRSGNMLKDFPELKNPQVCTDVACYQVKQEAATAQRLKEAAKGGQTVLATQKAYDQYGRLKDDYVELNKKSYDLTGYEDNRELKKVMGKFAPPAILVAGKDGEVVEVVTKEEAQQALKAAGFKTRESAGNSRYLAEQRAKEKKVKQRRQVAAEATPAMLKALMRNGELTEKAWELVSSAVYDNAGIDVHSFIAKRRGMAKSQTEARDKLSEWLESKERTTAENKEFVLEALVCAQHGVSMWSQGYAERFEEAARLAGVDLAAAEKELQSEGPRKPAKDVADDKQPVEPATEGRHNWDKTDLVSGTITNYRCIKCGVKAIRHGVEWPPRIAGGKDPGCKPKEGK